MLVLTRKVDEEIIIMHNDKIIALIKVCEIPTSRLVKLGFNADPSIVIRRKELIDGHSKTNTHKA